jgi:hypothetical protein
MEECSVTPLQNDTDRNPLATDESEIQPNPQQGDEYLFPRGSGRGLNESGELFALPPQDFMRWSWPAKKQ